MQSTTRNILSKTTKLAIRQSLRQSFYTGYVCTGYICSNSFFFVKRKYFYLAFFFLYMIFLFSCRSALVIPNTNAWKKVKPVLIHGFQTYSDPEIRKNLDSFLKEKAAIRDRLKQSYFPLYRSSHSSIVLILYAKRENYVKTLSFKRQRSFQRAHYRRVTGAIHISLDASNGVWRHELTHALLEEIRPRSPIWLHEGLANFLQRQKITPLSECSLPRSVYLSKHLLRRSSRYARKEKDAILRLLHSEKKAKSYRYYELNSLLMYYLWSRKKLGLFLQNYQNTKKSAIKTLSIISGKKTSVFMLSFYSWLSSENKQTEMKGC